MITNTWLLYKERNGGEFYIFIYSQLAPSRPLSWDKDEPKYSVNLRKSSRRRRGTLWKWKQQQLKYTVTVTCKEMTSMAGIYLILHFIQTHRHTILTYPYCTPLTAHTRAHPPSISLCLICWLFSELLHIQYFAMCLFLISPYRSTFWRVVRFGYSAATRKTTPANTQISSHAFPR